MDQCFQVTAYKAFRSYYIAQAFISSQKWGEAMAVFQRSLKYSAEVLNIPPNKCPWVNSQLLSILPH